MPKIFVSKDRHGFVTENGKAFVPFGVTYYRPGTGWAPQVWKKFDAEATSKDFALMKTFGINCVRVFVSYGSFYTDIGELGHEGLQKFDKFLEIAEAAGIYVHPTGPDHWEGMPNWQPVSIEDDKTLAALESFWKLFAARYRNRNVIFAYDLKNEPEVPWTSETLERKWRADQQARSAEAADSPQAAAVPSDKPGENTATLLQYQLFREGIAREWTRRQVAAIKSVDAKALVTVGLIQWSVPYMLAGNVRYYAAFRPEQQAEFLDFMEIHFYPLANGAYEYRSDAELQANLAYAECLVREVARAGKPVVLAEFGWYGGGKPRFDRGNHPAASEEQHATYCRKLVQTTSGFAVGWLNWGFYDQPEATDCSEMTGLVTADGKTKAWGKTFQELSSHLSANTPAAPKLGPRPELNWNTVLTSVQAQSEFRESYFKAFSADTNAMVRWNSP